MTKEFYFKLVSVVFIMTGSFFLIFSILLLPSYFMSSVNKKLINQKLGLQKNEILPVSYQNTLDSVRDLKSKINSVENSEKNKFVFSTQVMNEIILKKPAGIKIIGISYDNIEGSGKKVDVSGIAQSREALLFFGKVMQNDTMFSNVNLPISNFVKGSNISFNMDLTPS